MTPQTNSLYSKIELLLKSIPDFLTEEKELRYNKIKEMAENGDVKLLEPLLKDEKIKSAFFAPVLDSFVFKTKEFKEFLDYSSSNNSYSQFLGKKIGLYVGDSALTDRSEVVLNFPFKDCVLEGGQRKEDGLDVYFSYDEKTGDYVEKTDKRREVFFNETLAKDEIDSLFSPKAFCNVKKFTKDGEETCAKFERNAELNRKRGLSEDTITDNLVIKGNNLLALHSLKKEFEGKVKCTFLDPPYYFVDNKPSDTFSYNSNFKLSSWLTFMKDRIQITRNLLSEDGLLFITISDEGAHYLKVLIDDIFGVKNFIADITWESRKSISSDGLISLNSNHVLVFAKDIKIIKKNDFRLALDLESFCYDDNDGRGKYRLEPFDAPGIRKNLSYEIENPNTHEKFIPPMGRHWRTEKETYEKYLNEKRIRFGVNGTAKPQYKAYYSEVVEAGKGKSASSIFHDVKQSILWENLDSNTNATKDLQKLFESIVFTNPKPEDLISRIIELSTTKK